MNNTNENGKERKYTVYMHMSPSGKRYIGITRQDPKLRWRNGNGYKNNTYFYRAIKKYGWDNFKHEILFIELSKKEAEQKEIELIMFYKSNQKHYGYNIQNGGSSNGKHSEISIEKIKKAASNLSEETRVKQSKSQKIRMSNPENNPMFGKHHTDVAKRKISEARNGIKLSNETREKMSKSRKKKVFQYTKNNELIKSYDSVTDASKQTGINCGNISACCCGNGKQKTAGGFIWRYANEKCREAI